MNYTKDLKFLNKLNRENKLELVEPSDDICVSYLIKAEDSFKSAKLLFDNDLHENSVAMSYYAMYNSLLALLFKIGIKSENHTGSIILLRELFANHEIHSAIEKAKKERINRQYYVNDEEISKEATQNLLKDAEEILLELKTVINTLNNQKIEDYRTKLNKLIANRQKSPK